MAKFKVAVFRSLPEKVEVEVEADNLLEARVKALCNAELGEVDFYKSEKQCPEYRTGSVTLAEEKPR